MLLPAGKIEHRLALRLVSRDLVGDNLFGFRHGFADSLADAFEGNPRGLRLRGNILVYRLEISFRHMQPIRDSLMTEILALVLGALLLSPAMAQNVTLNNIKGEVIA